MQQKKQRLGDALVQSGLIAPDQLNAALEQQRSTGTRLGRVLIQQGFVSEVDVARVVAAQTGLPFLAEDQINLDARAARLIPEAVARRLLALPVREDAGSLVVGMVDPYNVFALDEIRSLIGRDTRPVVITEQALHGLLRSVHQMGSQAEGPQETPVVDAPAVKLVSGLIEQALEQRASDIHWEPMEKNLRVRFRVDGFLREVATVPASLQAAVVSRLKILAELDISERRLPQDGRFNIWEQGREIDIRVSTLPTVHGEKVALRLLDRSHGLLGLGELGQGPMLNAYRSLINRPYGLVLVTGPTGSGKTTTLMSTLAELNRPDRNIITIEDPVEYHIPGVNQIQVNPRAGLDFAGGLRAILRQDPNIVMVGEIRDGETADVALRAALTGHLVFSTLHTNDASGALTRLADMGAEPYLLASSVVGVMAQRLVRRLCSRCRVSYTVAPGAVERLGLPLPEGPVTAFRPGGCPHCGHTGYSGRQAIFELMTLDEPLRELVAGRAPASALAAQARAGGMRTLLEDGIAKALEGETSLEEVRRVALVESV